MLDNGRISSLQLLFILVIGEVATAFLFAPAKVTEIAGPDSWMSASIVSSLFGLAVVLVVFALARRFPSQVFTEYLPEVLGRWPGKLLALIYTAFFIQATSAILSQGYIFFHVAILRETPPVAVAILLIAVAAYGAWLGIEAIARQIELVLPVWVGVVAVTIFLVAKDVHLSNLKPVLGNGLLPVLRAGAVGAVSRGEIVLLFMLFPYLNKQQDGLKTALLAIGLLTFASAFTFVVVGVFGAAVTAHLVFPWYELARYISLAHFVERMEVLIVFIWALGVFVKLALFLYIASIAVAIILGLKNYRLAIIPVAATVLILSRMLYGTYMQLAHYLFNPLYITTFELAIPALILLIAVIRKKRGRSRGDQENAQAA